jgi:hypothetical protein
VFVCATGSNACLGRRMGLFDGDSAAADTDGGAPVE